MPDARAVADLRGSSAADLVRATRLIAILRRVEPQARLLELVAALADDGVRVFEVTFDAATAADDLAACRTRLDAGGHRDAIVGAGTIRTIDLLEAAVEADAAFAVSPTLDLPVVERSIALGVPVIPGAYSPTEIDLAWRAGAHVRQGIPGIQPGSIARARDP